MNQNNSSSIVKESNLHINMDKETAHKTNNNNPMDKIIKD